MSIAWWSNDFSDVFRDTFFPQVNYKIITIGKLQWFAQNYRRGISLDTEFPDNNPSIDLLKYGYLYSEGFFESNPSEIPEGGWRLPTRDDFLNLLSFYSVNDLKSREEWPLNNNGTNLSKFNIYPAGDAVVGPPLFFSFGLFSTFIMDDPQLIRFNSDNTYEFQDYIPDRAEFHSVRFVRSV